METPDAGVMEPGHGCKIGYFAQEHDTLDDHAVTVRIPMVLADGHTEMGTMDITVGATNAGLVRVDANPQRHANIHGTLVADQEGSHLHFPVTTSYDDWLMLTGHALPTTNALGSSQSRAEYDEKTTGLGMPVAYHKGAPLIVPPPLII